MTAMEHVCGTVSLSQVYTTLDEVLGYYLSDALANDLTKEIMDKLQRENDIDADFDFDD